MTDWWVHRYWAADPVLLIAWIVWVVVSIVLHELGHGYAAEREGDPTPRRSGHLTLNPAVHIPPFAWVLFAFVGITWGLMPVRPENFRRGRVSEAIVAVAGPLVNIGLALALILLTALWMRFGTGSPQTLAGVYTFLIVGASLNITLALFNMLPLPPLDGSRILGALVPPLEKWLLEPRVQTGAFAVLIIMAMLGLFSGIISLGLNLAQRASMLVAGWLL
ncbi:MAG: site-2 protease family protein [Phycisphaeraceae bacterium]|nr:site-2 protease family protein [Phycisphaeraceae bacterium]